MNFELALKALKDGKLLTRTGWNGKNMYIALQTPKDKSKMTLPYLYMKTAQNDLIPWVISHSDLLSDDWMIMYGKISIDDMTNDEFFEECMKTIPKKIRKEDKDMEGREVINSMLKYSSRKEVLKSFTEVSKIMEDLFNIIK